MLSLRRLAPPHLLLTAYCAGLLLSLLARAPAWAPGSTAVAATGLCLAARRAVRMELSHRWNVALTAGLSLLLLSVGLGVGGSRIAALEQSALVSATGETVPLSAVVTDLPDVEPDQVTLAVDVRESGGAPLDEPAHLRLRLEEGQRYEYDPCGPLTEGALVELSEVRVRPLPEAQPGRFDYGRYLRRRGEHCLLEADFSDLSVVGHRRGWRGSIDELRLASRRHLQRGLQAPVRDVLQGMVLGDDEGVEPEIIDDFRRSGLLHIMAVSGENVVLLCGMWSFAFTLLAIPRLMRTALLAPVVATYVLLTGADPSIVRAGVAGIVGLLAIMVSRPSDGWLLWLAPGAWLLTANPHNLFDVSFQLSFGAVAGLLVLARPLTRALAFLPGPLPEQVGVTVAASLSTAPVSMLTFGSTSLVSVPANVAGGFVLGPIMLLGMLSLLLGFVGSWVSVPLNLLAGLLIGFLITVARLFGRLSWAVYEWRGLSVGLLLAGVAAILAVSVWLLARRAGVGVVAYTAVSGRRARLLLVGGAMVALVLVLTPRGPTAPSQATVTFLDVGEGAATLVQVPSGPTVLIDAGPSPLARDLREHAVRRIDLLVLSHGHTDHTGGLQDVIGSVPIQAALLPRPPEADAALERLAGELSAAGAEVRRCEAPLSLGGEGWGLRVLPTRALPGTSGNQGENDNALVVLAELGDQRVLLPGDVEGPALERLDLPPCSVVGVPHHGSAGGLDAGLLRALAPRLAVIPVGPNKHGHPTTEMLDLLGRAGVPCARTDQYGDVAVSVGGEGLTVRVERRRDPLLEQAGEPRAVRQISRRANSQTATARSTAVAARAVSSGITHVVGWPSTSLIPELIRPAGEERLRSSN